MAEDDTSGLASLIQQRKNRPSYARTVSWEILDSSCNPSCRARKSGQRRKKKENEIQTLESEEECDEEDLEVSGNETDESEYFSAEEFISENRNDSDGQDEDESTENEDSSCEDVSPSLEANSVSKTSKEWKRGRSKKQKKKRRELVKLKEGDIYYPDYRAPFQHEEDMDFSLSDLREEIIGKTENESAHVLSLFQLCARSIWVRNSRPSSLGLQLLPHPLKQAAFTQRQSQAFSSLQLSVMFKNFAELESVAYTYGQEERKVMMLLVTRNIFSKCFAAKWHESEEIDPHLPYSSQTRIGNEITMVIPYSYAAFGLSDIEKKRHGYDIRLRMYKTSFMVSVLDLVVPPHCRPSRRKEKGVSELEEGDHALVVCVDVILRNLKKRYPKVVDSCRQQALPYLYWLRGHSKLAVDYFLQQSASVENVREKVYLLLEAALLCQLHQQMDSARKLFRQSHQLLMSARSARRVDRNREEITEQELALCANTYDQGVLGEEKALQSLGHWQYLVRAPCSPMSHQAAAESLLCFHLSHLPGESVRAKLQHVVGYVQVCSRHCRRVSLHLSLLHAWMGDRFHAIDAYRRSHSGADHPGGQFKPEGVRDTEFSPWLIVCDAVASGVTVKPLTVVWRTQLGFFRVVSSFDVFYGQLQGLQPGLRLSPEGHLTDDLHLLLPPVRAVNLDLYTGKLILPSSPGHTHVQKTVLNSWYPEDNYNAPQRTLSQYPNGTYAVTCTELYSDEAGRQVCLVTSRGSSVLRDTYPAVTHVHFVAPTGHRKKLNLKQILKTELRKEVEKEIHQWHEYPRSGSVENSHEKALAGLKYAVDHNLSPDSAADMLHIGTLLERIADSKAHKMSSKARCRQNCGCDPKRQLQMLTPFKFEVKDFVSYGHTLLVYGHLTSDNHLFSMFVDVTSIETFSRPVVHFGHLEDPDRCIFHVLGRRGHRVPRSDVLCVRHFYMTGKLRFFGPGGRELQQSVDGPDHSQCVLGSSVYFIENPRSDNDDDDNDDDQGNEQRGGRPMLMNMTFTEASTKPEIFLFDPDRELREVKTVADRLLLVRSDGLKILNPETMGPEPLALNPDTKHQCPLSDDGVTILLNPVRVTVLAEKGVLSPAGSPTVMVPVAVNDYLLVLGIQERNSAAEPVIEIAFCVKVPGHATECCLVGQSVGYVISTTFHRKHDTAFYRETLCHLSPRGELLALLPCLGPGPHGFFPLLLPPPPQQGEEAEGERRREQSSWHVYMRDGHEGIIAVRL